MARPIQKSAITLSLLALQVTLHMVSQAVGGLGLTGTVLAQTRQSPAQPHQPSDPGAPDSRRPAGTRGGKCGSQYVKLTALAPSRTEGLLTVAIEPTFFVHVPQTEVKRAEFLLFIPNDRVAYRVEFSLLREGGIVSLQLPASIRDNAVMDQPYTWSFSLLCSDDPLSNPTVEGFMEFTTLVRETPLSPSEEVHPNKVDHKTDPLWYDRLAALGSLMRQDPYDTNLWRQWEYLLQTIEKLDTLSPKPLLDHYRLPPEGSVVIEPYPVGPSLSQDRSLNP